MITKGEKFYFSGWSTAEAEAHDDLASKFCYVLTPAPAKVAAPVEAVVAKSAPVAKPRSRPLADSLARTLGVRVPTSSQKLSQLEREQAERARLVRAA